MVVVKKEVQGVLLLLVGGAVLRLALGGSYINYVKPAMVPYLVLSGGVLVLLGALAIVDVLRHRASDQQKLGDFHDHSGQHLADDEQGDHGHSERMGTAWLLLLPVAAIFLIAPPPLGAYTAAREGSTVTQPRANSLLQPLPAGDPVEIPLNDYAVRAVWDNGTTLVDRRVKLIGFVTPQADTWVLTRLGLACCAADAVATKVQPVGDVGQFPANTWVEVVGSYVPGGGAMSDDAVPWVQVESITEIPQPSEPYL